MVRISQRLNRPAGRLALAFLVAWIVTAPAVLFFDPATYRPGSRGHIPREPMGIYRLFSDDVAYVAGSMGTLIGADIMNLHRVVELGAPMLSIGGAGTFDGVFLTGIIAGLLA